ncbi:MAG: HEAT repeat domain-containing protein [Dehalococcoidia bacterium]
MTETGPALELGTGERIPLAESLVIGRSTEADLVLADAEASRKHAQIRASGQTYLISDLESRNGTTVNGEAVIEPRVLRDGDEIRMGKTSMVFRAPPPPEPTPAPADATIMVEPTMQLSAVPMSPMQVLGRISRQISGIVDAKQLADSVTHAIKEEYGCEGASLILVDDEADELYFASVASEQAVALQVMTLRRGEGIAGDVIERQEPVLVANVARAANHARKLDEALGFESRSIVAAPVIGAEGRVLGTLEAVNPLRKAAFDNDDMEFISLVAGQLGVALENARSWDAIERERMALSRVAGIRRNFVATAPATVRLVVEVAAMHAQRTPIYLCGEPGTGKRLLVRLTHETSGDPGEVIEIDGAAGLPANLEQLVGESTVHVTRLDQLSIDNQERFATALAASGGKRATYASGPGTLLTLLSAGKLAPSLHAAFEAGQRLLPPLRNRTDELEGLVEHEVTEVTGRLRRSGFTFSPDGFARMRDYRWPGNIAELAAVVRRIGILTREPVVDLADLDEFAPELNAENLGLDQASERLGAIERKSATRIAAVEEALDSNEAGQWRDALARLEDVPGEAPVPVLGRLLASQDASQRMAAAVALRGRPGAAEAAAARLEEETEPGVAVALIETLRLSGDGAAQGAIESQLGASAPSARRQAIRALRMLSPETVRVPAETASNDADPGVAAEALAALCALGVGDAGERLLAMAGDAADETAATAIGLCGELKLGVEQLLAVAESGDQVRRVAAIRALAAMGDEVNAPGLLALIGDAAVRVEIINAMGDLRAAAASDQLRALAADASAPVLVRRSALIAIARVNGPGAAAIVAPYLEDGDLRDSAIESLTLLPGADAEALLLSQLASTPARANEIMRALAEFGSVSSVGPLLAAGSASPQHDLAVLVALVRICGRVADRSALADELDRALEPEETRLLGLQLLGELLEPRTTPTLLKYRDWSQEARIALSRLGPRAMQELLIALQGPHRDAAEETLAEIGADGVPYILPMLGSPELGRSAARVIQAVGETALPALLDAAEKRNSGLLPAVLQLIGRVGAARMAPYVATFLESESGEARYAAIVALGDLGDPRGEEELIKLMDSPDTITAGLATLALGRTRSARAFELILPRLGEGDRRLQYANAAAIGNFNLRQPTVLAQVKRAVREGLPISALAVESAFRGSVLSAGDVVHALVDTTIPESQKLRTIATIGQLPPELSVSVLSALFVVPEVADAYEPQLVTALLRHEREAATAIRLLIESPDTRSRGIAVLEAMSDPQGLLGVLRSVAPLLENDDLFRKALRARGDQLLGPLLDILYQNWDLASLALLWQLSEVVEQQPKA